MKRYSRQIILPEIGEQGQQKILDAKVLVVGAGGLGCPVLQYLAAAGVGTLGIVDFDTIDETNLQRQILYTVQDIGKLKAEVAAQKVKALNPEVNVSVYTERLHSGNALNIFKAYDLIVDGTDNFSSRYLINDACAILNKPLVFGAVYRFEGQVSVFNYQNGPTYRCLFPESPEEGERLNCAEIGVIGTIPGIVGTMQANEVIKIITGAGEVMSGKLWQHDALSGETQLLSFEANPENKKVTSLKDHEVVCETSDEVNAEELKQLISSGENIQLIDVREEHEYQLKNINGLLIPLNRISSSLNQIKKDRKVIIHCQTGVRSRRAVDFLKQKGFVNVFNLKNGLIDF